MTHQYLSDAYQLKLSVKNKTHQKISFNSFHSVLFTYWGVGADKFHLRGSLFHLSTSTTDKVNSMLNTVRGTISRSEPESLHTDRSKSACVYNNQL